MSPARGPLAGVRVIEVATMVSGPLATSILADQGADVIKVEAPGTGDPIRRMGSSRGGISAVFQTVNRSKRSVAVDLRTPRGQDLCRRLADGADVFLENLRPGVLAELGLGADALCARNPRLVHVAISGFGQQGPYAAQPAYDVVIQALSGMAAVQGDRAAGLPALVRTVVCDKITAIHAAQAATAALFARERGAGGQRLEVSLLDAAIAFLWPEGMEGQTYVGAGVSAPADMWALVGIYQTRDGHLSVLAITDEQFRGLVGALGAPALADDARFRTLEDRTRNAGALVGIVCAALAAEPTTAVCERLRHAGVPCAPVLSPETVPADVQVRAVELLVELEHPVAGTVRMPRAVGCFGGTPVARPRPAPVLGQHTDEILAEIGLLPTEIETLRREGTVG